MDLERSVTPWIAIATFLLALLAAVSLKAWEDGLFDLLFESEEPHSRHEQSRSGLGMSGGAGGGSFQFRLIESRSALVGPR